MFDQEFRKTLFISVVTSVLVLLFIEPVLKAFSNWMMWLGANVSTGFTNSIYASAAMGFNEKYSYMVLLVGVAIICGVLVGALFSRVLRLRVTIQAEPRARTVLIGTVALTTCVTIICAFGLLAVSFAELQLVTSFNQRTTVLAASVSDQEIKVIRARWALMTTRKDYEVLTEQMQELASKSGVKLPKPLWP